MNEGATISDPSVREIINFNFYPSLEIDDSWWTSDYLAISLFARLRKVKATHRKLSDFILARYQLGNKNYFEFTSYEKRAALLASGDLKALLYRIGLLIESTAIAGVIQRQTQQTIKKSLGEADYLYALKNRTAIRCLRGSNKIVPTAERKRDFSNFKRGIYQSGLRCLLALLNDMPQDFIQRILFKLPKEWSESTGAGDKDDYKKIKTCLPHLFKELKTS